MHKDDLQVIGWSVVMVVVAMVLSAGLVWLVAGFEADSYNKYCDNQVTTWDAVWLDLRIDECVRCDDG